MNEKTKNVWMTILYFVLYIVLVLVAELPGFVSPYYWVCVPVLVAMPSCLLLPLYFQTELFTETALGEMSPEYVATLAKCAHGWVFILVTVLVIGAGVLSERLTEKLFIRK